MNLTPRSFEPVLGDRKFDGDTKAPSISALSGFRAPGTHGVEPGRSGAATMSMLPQPGSATGCLAARGAFCARQRGPSPDSGHWPTAISFERDLAPEHGRPSRPGSQCVV